MPIWRRVPPALLGLPAAAALAYVLLLGIEGRGEPLPGPDERDSFPDFTLPALDGRPWTLSSHRGSVVLANFWNTGCGPCRAEMPALAGLAQRYAGRGELKIIGVSLDEDPRSVVPKFVKDYRIPYPVLACFPLVPQPPDENKPREYCEVGRSIRGIPTSLLIDRAGRLPPCQHE